MKATVDAGAFFKALNRVIPLLRVSAIPALSPVELELPELCEAPICPSPFQCCQNFALASRARAASAAACFSAARLAR